LSDFRGTSQTVRSESAPGEGDSSQGKTMPHESASRIILCIHFLEVDVNLLAASIQSAITGEL
jgi:hypothetical protein